MFKEAYGLSPRAFREHSAAHPTNERHVAPVLERGGFKRASIGSTSAAAQSSTYAAPTNGREMDRLRGSETDL
jgi:hypothetical protein